MVKKTAPGNIPDGLFLSTVTLPLKLERLPSIFYVSLKNKVSFNIIFYLWTLTGYTRTYYAPGYLFCNLILRQNQKKLSG
jgi:hypothetical protein